MAEGRIIWDNPIPENLARMYPKLEAYIGATLDYKSQEIQGDMRANAPWTDRTGNARNGLFCQPYGFFRGKGSRDSAGKFQRQGSIFGLVMYHSVPYGIWLEIRWSGRYAIIVPTLASEGPEVMSLLNNVINRAIS